jgi:DNA polymerase
MAELESAIEKFELCGLAKYATRAVRGTGQQASPGLLIIGEIPGEEDDSLGTAFSGARGELLNSMLDKAGLSLESGVFAMTAIPFRTPGERAPTSEEASVLKPFLVRAIELLAPRAILAMGGLPCEMLCNRDEAIAQIRGEFLDFGGRALMPTFSIDYLLREKAARIKTWDDLKKVIARI